MSVAMIFDYVAAGCSGALALATLLRAGRSLPRWAFAAGMAVLAVESVFNALSHATDSPSQILRWQTWRLTCVALIPGTWLLFSLCYARGREQLVSWRSRLTVIGALVVPAVIAVAFRDRLALSVPRRELDTPWLLELGPAGTALIFLLLVSSVWVVVNFERTFRASVGTMRWRIKFMLLGAGFLFAVRIYTSSQILIFRGVDSALETVNSGALIVASLLILRSFFRTGHFELEVYPSQKVLQNSFTVLIAGAYLLIVGVLAKVVSYFGGDSAFAAKAFLVLVALVVLTIALQSDRARLQLRQFVSRHFHRSPYDYRAVWKTFTEGTASRVDESDLCRGLVRLTADTFHALSVSIWLMDDKGEQLNLAASTATPTGGGQGEPTGKGDAAALSAHFLAHADPVDIEENDAEWAASLRRVHPTQFAKGGHRVCVPMIGRGQLLGVLILGDRVGGVPFSLEDFDMLKCVADHASAGILNVQLSKKLLQAKELEAFQAMAAFFVHDLKNAASTLNLMLQNLPVHYDDPEFRADALRGISKTVTHINRLISRLGLLRHELKIEAVPADLNELVDHVLTGIERSPGFVLTKEIQPLPKVSFDRDQMHKVITNLVLNATEAVPAGGSVRVATSQENGWAVLSVTDNGCGMSPDFLAQSLFRPFQTTKKNGLGIGMFQSKMIIEAHGGRIAVQSEAGKGTTFRVFLRANAPS
jgi:putative PEP-CTERM system histidine kinase